MPAAGWTLKELLTFNQELLVLMKAGLPIIQTLDTILEKSGKGKLTEILQEVREDIKGGAALSEAFEKHTRVFSHLYIASIRAGEKTGDLPQTLRRYIAFIKRVEGFRKKVISAFIYPAILVTVAFLAVTVLLIYVVPTFTKDIHRRGFAAPDADPDFDSLHQHAQKIHPDLRRDNHRRICAIPALEHDGAGTFSCRRLEIAYSFRRHSGKHLCGCRFFQDFRDYSGERHPDRRGIADVCRHP